MHAYINKDIRKLKIKAWRKICHTNTSQKNSGVTLLILDRADFRAIKVIRDIEEHYIIIKWSILQEDIIIHNVHIPNNQISTYVRQKLNELQEKLLNLLLTVGH